MSTRDHGRILCKIWQDKDFKALPRSAQAMYMQLLSQPTVNNAGVLQLQVDKWARGCDEMTTEQVWADLGTLSQRGFIVVDVDSFEVLIRSFIRNDGGMAHKYIFKNALRCAEAAESDQIRQALAIELYRLRRADATRVAEILAPREPVEEPSESDSNAEVNPSESHSNPIEIPSESGMAFEPDSDHCGVGEGEGVGETPVVGYVGGSRASAHTYADAREAPPPHCPQHPGGTTDPCGACRSARERREAFDRDDAERTAAEAAERAEAERRRKRQVAEDKARAIANCAMCRDTGGYRGTVLCDHDPDTPDRAARHLAEIRAGLAAKKAAKETAPNQPPPEPVSPVHGAASPQQSTPEINSDTPEEANA